ncbi:MAG: adenosylcobinamide-GDP ribazoletransferase [Gammaproteobacteria bacterium]|nr:adenosylcobinamide-GDP ribazoletransferase [Gammaproteobacteria bacterium]
MTAFLAAVQFLTLAPVRLRAQPSDAQLGSSLLFYPLVGALLGGALSLLAALCANLPPLVTAALLLAALSLASGGLHLDGLADSCDALAGGGDRARALAIMRDPRCGALGAAAVGVVLIAKFAAFAALASAGAAGAAATVAVAIIAAVTAARAAVIALYLSADYVRPAGLGAAMAANLPRAAGFAVVAVTAVAIAAACVAGGGGLGAAAAMLTAAAVAFMVCRRLMVARIGGATGDTTGATVETVETATLLAAAAAF